MAVGSKSIRLIGKRGSVSLLDEHLRDSESSSE
jgi:hypothetical protein